MNVGLKIKTIIQYIYFYVMVITHVATGGCQRRLFSSDEDAIQSQNERYTAAALRPRPFNYVSASRLTQYIIATVIIQYLSVVWRHHISTALLIPVVVFADRSKDRCMHFYRCAFASTPTRCLDLSRALQMRPTPNESASLHVGRRHPYKPV